jgi:hypothetical protein
MTHFDSDAELDALLQTADEAVLTAVEDTLDLDAGRAAIFALVTTPDRGDQQPPSWTIGRDGTVTDFAGIPVEPTYQHEIRIEGSVMHWSCTIETNDLVNQILELVDEISYDLDLFRRWLDCLSDDEPLVPGRVENAATWLAVLVMGVRERNMSEQMAVDTVGKIRHELRLIQAELRPCFDGKAEDRKATHVRISRLDRSLTTAKRLVEKLFADDGDHSFPLPVPVR